MTRKLLTKQQDFDQLCAEIKQAGLVAFDTEFISEHTYRPDLCLLQFKTGDRCVAVDPLSVRNLDKWWELMADEDTTVVVHGGQAEVKFCLDEFGKPPRNLVDIQIAEGLRSSSYPLGYTALVQRLLNTRISGGETRTDWRKRPLSDKQIHYALNDVEHPLKIWEIQQASLKKRNRLAWAEAEFQRMIDLLADDVPQNNWPNLKSIHRLSRRELAVACAVYRWREEEAQELNKPPRIVLRDDLIIELAQRQPSTEKDLLATRDMNRSSYRRRIPQMLDAVRTGKAVPEDELPKLPKSSRREKPNEHVLGKLLSLALSNRCAQEEVAMSLVGTSEDLRQLVRHHVYHDETLPPSRLTQGWRAEVCGNLLTDLLDGKLCLRVTSATSAAPLQFEMFPQS